MNARDLTCVVLLLALMAPTIGLARKWTDASGNYSIQANFIEVKDGNVILQKANGKVISVPLERLSTPDQEFVKSKSDTDRESFHILKKYIDSTSNRT